MNNTPQGCIRKLCTASCASGERVCLSHLEETRTELKREVLSKVKKGKGRSPCWIWTASKTKQGYGMKGTKGLTASSSRPAHSVSLFAHTQGTSLNSGGEVHHVCKNASCVNPKHLVCLPIEWHALAHQLSEPNIAKLFLQHLAEVYPKQKVKIQNLLSEIS